MIDKGIRVLRISHSAVVDAWRQRERELRRGGVEVRLLSADAWDEGGDLVRFVGGEDDFAIPVRTLGTHPNLFVYDPRPLWRALGDRRWDAIDIHEEPCSLATAEVLMLRAIRRVRSPYFLYSAQNIDKRYPPPFRWVERWALRHAAGVSVCNSAAGLILRRKGLRGTVAEIPLGVDVVNFAPRDRPAPAGGLTIGYVGRLATHKGVQVLIDALAGLPDARLVAVGSGPQRDALRERAARSGVHSRVDFRGHAAGDQLAEIYREFDVLAIPSLDTPRWVEQFGRVAVEAMASGVPVVASRSGALPDVLGAAGILVAPGDVDAWRDALATMSTDATRWQHLRDAGLRRARDFGWTAVAEAMAALYATAWGETGPPAAPRELDVIVVAYGPPEVLQVALAPLVGHFPMTIVDNCSSDQTRHLAEDLGARYLRPGTNLGFGAGVNYALHRREDPRRDVLLLNPDAQISAEDVHRLHEQLIREPGLACVGPRQVDAAGHPSRVSWPFPSPAGAWLDALGASRLRRPGFVIGSVLVVRATALDQVGDFDERFFLYAEETDWQRRAVRAGWSVREVPDVVARHAGAGTGGDASRREAHFHASQERLIRKHFGASGWTVYRAGAIVGAGLRTVGPGRARRLSARSQLRRYLRGPVRMQRELDGGPGTAA